VRLIGDDRLAGSWVVANRDMNRGRGLSGRDGYSRVLGVDLRARLAVAGTHWLDLCCGEGKALLEAAGSLPARLTGVDLVGPVDPPPGVRFMTAPVAEWVPEERFDLITCVHGLHYVGDKLGLLARVASWLTADGLFVADFDVGSIRFPGGEPAVRRVVAALRAAGFAYDGRAHRISRRGPGDVEFAFQYLGADDHAGPNYTGQPAVHSYYEQVAPAGYDRPNA
jgi:ubiquinone/menaquinone biosynthesis C-methylase UbiE